MRGMGTAVAVRSGCTYRVQLHAGFTFDNAAAQARYLARLGVTHLYCSPYLQAAGGSTHGYDVVDHERLNEELGGEAAYGRMVEALTAEGLRQVLDIVPNHMAIDGRANRWWWDVLRNGESSPYARFFDIEWDPAEHKLAGMVLVPVLGDHYGRVLEAGDLRVERQGDAFVVRYYDHEFPLAPGSIAGDADLDRLNADPNKLDTLLQRQNFRLAFWRIADEELNYRRFFTIETLAGLCVEDERVFAATHGLILDLVAKGVVDGLRVDHVDGLRDPEGYLRRLSEATGGAYVVVEKILEEGEALPESWPVAGTSGYDFLNQVNNLFVDGSNEAALTACYHSFIGEDESYEGIVHAAKQQIMSQELASEVDRATGLLADACEGHRRHRDHTRRALRDALREVAAAFPVYRTYVRPGRPVSDADRAHVAEATSRAAARRPDLDGELLDFIGELLVLQHPGTAEAAFAVRFQQLSSPVMAKGVEDTAFYRYHRLISLNEVGGDPGTFGRPAAQFHTDCARTAERWPGTMLTLSTHDTKRSGDVRARINLLSELPQEWEETVRRWAAINERYRKDDLPDRNAEYLLYQTLAGAWPIDADRACAFMDKAAREAKVHTSWTAPVAEYDEALQSFVRGILDDEVFVVDLERFLAEHHLVERGRVNSLAQITLLLTCPGVPDLYQGSEVWDLSLVDPDNRRPVDYERCRRLLEEVTGYADALARADEGAPKLWLIHRLLDHRRRCPDLYATREYEPLTARGAKAAHAVAFARGGLAVVVPRLVAGLADDWADTTLALPPGRWTEVVTGSGIDDGEVTVADLLRRFPVAVLARADG